METFARMAREASASVVVALRGAGAAGGEVQALLEDAGVPYTGSPSPSARIAANKVCIMVGRLSPWLPVS